MNYSKKLVSVIMPCFNCEKTVAASIESILNQTYQNIEILIIDDGSKDNTYEILKKFQSKHKNIRLFKNQNNLGLTKSLNILIEESKGEYIARQDSDDISVIDRISLQYEFMEQKELDFCSSRATILYSGKKIPRSSHYLPKKIVMKFKNPFIHGTLFIKKSILLDVGKYNENFYYAQDYKLMKTLIDNNYKFKIFRKPLYELNMENNISTNKRSEQNYYANCVKKNIIPELKV
tara:strand:+ start:1127 stop:1828 length:702 start_codon:yes stop_codon:yes gene_type:complete